METLPFEYHLILEELKWMIGFTFSDVNLFLFRITEQNQANMFARQRFWKVPGTINKVKLETLTKNRKLDRILNFLGLLNYIN